MRKNKDILADLILPTDAEVRRETFNDRRARANAAKNKTAVMRERAGSANRGKKRPNHSAIMKANSPGLEKTRIEWTCEHCGKNGKGSSNYTRWHKDGICGERK